MHKVSPKDDGRKKEDLGSINKVLHRPQLPWVYFIMSRATGITL